MLCAGEHRLDEPRSKQVVLRLLRVPEVGPRQSPGAFGGGNHAMGIGSQGEEDRNAELVGETGGNERPNVGEAKMERIEASVCDEELP